MSISNVRVLLLGTLLLGVAQQIFVVVRNPLLLDLGWRASAIPAVQSIGAAAGVASGFVMLIVSSVSARTALVACALVQSVGFAIQSAAHSSAAFLVGAAVAGFAIQWNSAMAPPLLKSITDETHRVRVFSLHAAALTALAGILAALAIYLVTRRWPTRATLTASALLSVVAAFVFVSIRAVVPPRGPLRVRRWRRVAFCIVHQALVAFAAAITVPFLQLYFKVTFGLSIGGIAWLYGATMTVGLIGYAAVPRLARRFGLVRSIVLLQALMLPLFLELAATTSVRVAAGAFVARYALAATAAPLLNAFYQEASIERDGEAVAGIGMIASSVAWALGTLAAGPLLALGGGRFAYAIAASAIVNLAVLAISVAVFPRLQRTM